MAIGLPQRTSSIARSAARRSGSKFMRSWAGQSDGRSEANHPTLINFAGIPLLSMRHCARFLTRGATMRTFEEELQWANIGNW
jgi:hypothetical protein